MRIWFRIFVAFVSVTLLGVIISKVDVYKFIDVFIHVKLSYYIYGLIMIVITMPFFAYRWKISLSKDSGIDFLSLLYRVVTSYFFNNLFLGVFGGDIYKALRIHKKTGKFLALFSVIYNRIINTYAAAVIPFLLLPFLYNKSEENLFIYYSLILSSLISFIFVLISIVKSPLINFISSKFKKAEKITQLKEVTLSGTMAVSVLIQLLNIFAHYLFATALGINIGFADLALLYSVSAVIISIPISINGIGVREGVFIFAFSFWNISAENALAFSFLSFTNTIVLSIIGGSIFVIENVMKAKSGE